ncbi:MAG: hypothetical protein A2413_06245 [Treponema sp. RIFOXYC1_FULL_61_9]|nr:MAG: hypothetical protein A2413_06245 [Treponema sp. RIFOXYC1_FULL_61_9]
MRVAIRYFTGTGNTARACSILAEEFIAASWDTDLMEVRENAADPYAGLDGADLTVIAFPVLGFAPPITMKRWLSRIPKDRRHRKGQDVDGHRRNAAVLCVGGAAYHKGRYIPGWGADAPFAAARILKRRGLSCAAIAEVSYPENWRQISNPPDEDQCRDIRGRNDPAVRNLARALAAGERSVLERDIRARVLMAGAAALIGFFGRGPLTRTFIAASSCTGCGLCARGCPAGAIRMRRGRPRWTLKCVDCNRCINTCPVNAIRTSSLALASHFAWGLGATAVALSVPLPLDWPLPARVSIRSLALLAFFAFQLGPFSALLALARAVPRFRPRFERSFMEGFRRNLAPDFNTDELQPDDGKALGETQKGILDEVTRRKG